MIKRRKMGKKRGKFTKMKFTFHIFGIFITWRREGGKTVSVHFVPTTMLVLPQPRPQKIIDITPHPPPTPNPPHPSRPDFFIHPRQHSFFLYFPLFLPTIFLSFVIVLLKYRKIIDKQYYLYYFGRKSSSLFVC